MNRQRDSKTLDKRFGSISSWVADWAGRPGTTIFMTFLVLVWAVSGPWFHYSSTWQLIINTATTVLTFLMVFVLQATQNRDSLALHVKLDELIEKLEGPRDEVAGVESMTKSEIEDMRAEHSGDSP